MRLADQLISWMLRESSLDFSVLGRAFSGRSAAWITPSGEVHNLPDALDYWHTHWVKDPANRHLIPDEHVANFSDGAIDAVSTKQRLLRAGWVRKSKHNAYEAHEPHVAHAVAIIRRHVRVHHPDTHTFNLDVVNQDGDPQPVRTVDSRTGAVARSDMSHFRSMDMPRGWDAYTAPSPAVQKASSRAGRRAKTAARSRRRTESLEEAFLSYQEIAARARKAGPEIRRMVTRARRSELVQGVDAEREHDRPGPLDTVHGTRSQRADTLIKIALAHLKERPDYYTRLKKVEGDR